MYKVFFLTKEVKEIDDFIKIIQENPFSCTIFSEQNYENVGDALGYIEKIAGLHEGGHKVHLAPDSGSMKAHAIFSVERHERFCEFTAQAAVIYAKNRKAVRCVFEKYGNVIKVNK